MVPSAFDQENTILSPPPEMSVDECETTTAWAGRIHNGLPVLISCWKVTAEELEEITRTGRVWLTVMGDKMPPIAISGMTPFVENRK